MNFSDYHSLLQFFFPQYPIDDLTAFHYFYNGFTVDAAVDAICLLIGGE